MPQTERETELQTEPQIDFGGLTLLDRVRAERARERARRIRDEVREEEVRTHIPALSASVFSLVEQSEEMLPARFLDDGSRPLVFNIQDGSEAFRVRLRAHMTDPRRGRARSDQERKLYTYYIRIDDLPYGLSVDHYYDNTPRMRMENADEEVRKTSPALIAQEYGDLVLGLRQGLTNGTVTVEYADSPQSS